VKLFGLEINLFKNNRFIFNKSSVEKIIGDLHSENKKIQRYLDATKSNHDYMIYLVKDMKNKVNLLSDKDSNTFDDMHSSIEEKRNYYINKVKENKEYILKLKENK